MNFYCRWAGHFFLLIGGWIVFSCARIPIKDPAQAMRPTNVKIHDLSIFEMDEEESTLRQAVSEQIDFFEERLKKISSFSDREKYLNREMIFGPKRVSVGRYIEALEQFLKFLQQPLSLREKKLYDYLVDHFELFEVYGNEKGWGEVFVTGYYEPIIKGYKRPHGRFVQPLYATPKSLVNVRLDLFKEALPSLTGVKDRLLEDPGESWPQLKGQLIRAQDPLKISEIIPFPDRSKIDGGDVLKEEKIELCYVDPIDAFFFHIQGSGKVQLEDKKILSLTYANQNGHAYYPIGREFSHVIAKEEMSLQTIIEQLRLLPIEKQKEILFKNPSYVFFKKSSQERGITFQGTGVISGRTIATDKKLFPKGAMAMLIFDRPLLSSDEESSPNRWIKDVRLVFDQDAGGAIKGTGRVDYFFGSGPQAGQLAGGLKSRGQLFYLVPRER